MKIVCTYPPNIETIRQHLTPAPGMIFAYGDTLYNPDRGIINQDQIVHEEVHAAQHAAFPGGPAAWWVRYLTDKQFRLNEELQAYQYQYRWAEENIKDRNTRAKFLWAIASQLSHPAYGKLISHSDALKWIRKVVPKN